MDTGENVKKSVENNSIESTTKSELSEQNETLSSEVVFPHVGHMFSSNTTNERNEEFVENNIREANILPGMYNREFAENSVSTTDNGSNATKYDVSNKRAFNIADIAKKFSSPERNSDLKITQTDSKVQIIEKITKIIESNIKEQLKKAEEAKVLGDKNQNFDAGGITALVEVREDFKVNNANVLVEDKEEIAIDSAKLPIKKEKDLEGVSTEALTNEMKNLKIDNKKSLLEDRNDFGVNSTEDLFEAMINLKVDSTKVLIDENKFLISDDKEENLSLKNAGLQHNNIDTVFGKEEENNKNNMHGHRIKSLGVNDYTFAEDDANDINNSSGSNTANESCETLSTDCTIGTTIEIYKKCDTNGIDTSNITNDTNNTNKTDGIDETNDTYDNDDTDGTADTDSSVDTSTDSTDDTDFLNGIFAGNEVEKHDIEVKKSDDVQENKSEHAIDNQNSDYVDKFEATHNDVGFEIDMNFKNITERSENSEGSTGVLVEVLKTEIDEKDTILPVVDSETEITAQASKTDYVKQDSDWNNFITNNQPLEDKNVKHQLTWWDEMQEHESHPDPLVTQILCDGNVLMRIVKHCTEAGETDLAQGALLGLLVGKCLEINHCFSYPKANGERCDEETYQINLMRRLRHVNIDHFHVGWYQNSNFGNFLSKGLLESQFNYQMNIEESVVLIYDSVKSAHGFLSLTAYRLSPQAIELYKCGDFTAQKMRRLNITFENLYHEIPIVYKNSALSNVLISELIDVVPNLNGIYPILEMGTDSTLIKYMNTFNFCLDHLFLDGIRQCKFLIQTSKANLEKQRALAKMTADNAFRASRGLPPKSVEEVLKNIAPVQVPSNIGAVVAASIINMNSISMAQFCAQSMAKLKMTVPLQQAKEKMQNKKKLKRNNEKIIAFKPKKAKKDRKKNKSSQSI